MYQIECLKRVLKALSAKFVTLNRVWSVHIVYFTLIVFGYADRRSCCCFFEIEYEKANFKIVHINDRCDFNCKRGPSRVRIKGL